MAGSRNQGPAGSHSVDIRDGTLCCAPSPTSGSLGHHQGATSTVRRKVKVLGFEGAKVYDSLYRVAMAQVQWENLNANPQAAIDTPVPRQTYIDRTSKLYDEFLAACSKGPNQATAFLAREHSLQKQYSTQSMAILDSLRDRYADNADMLAKLALAAQATKSLATVGVGVIGLLLEGPPILVGATVALGYDVLVEVVKHLGPSQETDADTVVVGAKQTIANDVVGAAGTARQTALSGTQTALEKLLAYPKKSSIYRSVAAEGVRVDALLKSLGVISLGVTLYSEWQDVKASYRQMQKAGEK